MKSLFSKLGIDVALYVGSDYIQIGTSKADMVTVPNYVTMTATDKRVLAVGDEAKAMRGKEPGNLVVENIVTMGIVKEYDVCEAFFRYCFRKYLPRKLVPPRIVISGQLVTDSGKRALKECAVGAGARDVMLLEAPMAAAIGIGIKVESPVLTPLLHIERDWAIFSVISLAGIAAVQFVPIGFQNFFQDISIYATETLSFTPEKESIEIELRKSGFSESMQPIGWEAWIDSIETGREQAKRIDADFASRACTPTFLQLRDAYSSCLHQLDSSKRMQLNASPLHLTGAFSDIPGFSDTLGQRLGKAITVAPNADRAAYDGTVEVLSEISGLIEYVTPAAKAK